MMSAIEAITPEELSRAAALFGTLKQLRLRLTNVDEVELDQGFEMHVQAVLDKLDKRLQTLGDSPVQNVELVMARHGLFDASFQQAILLGQNVSPILGDGLNELRSTHSRYLSELQRIIAGHMKEMNQIRMVLDNEKERRMVAENETKNLVDVVNLLDQEAETHKNTITALRQELLTAQHELANLQDTVQVIPAAPLSTGRRETVKKFDGFDTSMHKEAASPRKKLEKRSNSVSGGMSVVSTVAGTVTNTYMNSPDKYVHPSNSHQPDSWVSAFRADLQTALDEGRCRDISLKQCKEFIEKLYESKSIANSKLSQGANIPVETLEIHMYRTLEKKYGLRRIAAEYAGVILNAVDKYLNDDNYISVFHKTFRNEIEEDFWMVERELSSSLRDLAMVQVMSRHPTKDQPALNSLLEQKLNGFITEDEWHDMVHYLYNPTDSNLLDELLRTAAREEMIANGIQVPDVESGKMEKKNNNSTNSASNSGKSNNDPSSSPRPTITSSGPSTPSGRRTGNSNGGSVFNFSTVNTLNSTGPAGSSSKLQIQTSKQALNNHTEMSRKLGYNSPSLNKGLKNPTVVPNAKHPKMQYRISYQFFVKVVQDFQLKCHVQYLNSFRTSFKNCDTDADGILSANEFHDCFTALRRSARLSVVSPTMQRGGGGSNRGGSPSNASLTSAFQNTNRGGGRGGGGGESSTPVNWSSQLIIGGPEYDDDNEEEKFAGLLQLVDPFQTNRITFSTAASCLTNAASNAQ